MINRKTSRKRKKRANPLFILVIGIALFLAGSWSVQLFKIDQSIEKQKAMLYEQKTTLIAKNDNLRQEIENLNTPSYIEQLAREKLGLVRKGEILIAPREP